MTQEEVVAFWKETSDKDWEFSQEIYAGGKRYDYGLFFVHLSLDNPFWIIRKKQALMSEDGPFGSLYSGSNYKYFYHCLYQ